MYKILFTLLRLLSRMPLGVHYFLSDYLLFPLVYYLVRYRRKLVRIQLADSFPEKEKKELRNIERRFYHFFCDYFVETLKMETMSNEEMKRRVEFVGINEMQETLLHQGKNFCFAYLGHYGNWEWMASFPLWLHEPWQGAQIYHPLHNPEVDQHFLKEREKFGGRCIPMKQTLRQILTAKQEGRYEVIGFIADQAPKVQSLHHWIDFLNHKTAVFVGNERIARQVDAAPYYIRVTRPRRGYYRAEVLPMNISPEAGEEYAITNEYARLLEEQIREQPELWLWSHDRWKRNYQKWLQRQGIES